MRNFSIHTAFQITAATLAIVLAGPVQAGDPPESVAEVNALTDKAAALYDEGVIAFKHAEWAKARAAFLAAWSLKKHWQIAANLADAELALGKHREAAEHAAFYARNASADRKARADALLERAKAKVGTIFVHVDLPGAEVRIDEHLVGTSPLDGPAFVEPGRHEVQVRMGAQFAAAEITIGSGATRTLDLSVKAPAVRPSVAILVTGAALTAVSEGLGIGLMVASGAKASSADAKLQEVQKAGVRCESPPQAGACSDVLSLRRAQGLLHNAAVPLLIGGGVAAAATLVYGLWPRGPANDTAVHVSGMIGPDALGLTVQGRF